MQSSTEPTLRQILDQQPNPQTIDQISLLEIPVEWMRWCDKCQEETRFFADRFTRDGLIGKCAQCHNEGFARYTRTTTEVA